jgi:hypothetical protein
MAVCWTCGVEPSRLSIAGMVGNIDYEVDVRDVEYQRQAVRFRPKKMLNRYRKELPGSGFNDSTAGLCRRLIQLEKPRG